MGAMKKLHLKQSKRGDLDVVELRGGINEDSGALLNPLKQTLGPRCIFNWKGIDYVNSSGVRIWALLLRDIRKDREIFYEECSPPVISQLNMVSSLIEHVQINSVYLGLQCPSCRLQRQDLLMAGNYPTTPEALTALKLPVCSQCGAAMESIEPLDEYFEFAVSHI